MKAEQEHLKYLLTETIKSFINDNVKRHNALCVEGLIGITLNNEVFLVYVNESCTGTIGGTAANSDSCNGEANEGLGVVSDGRVISCVSTRNDEFSTLAGRDVDNGSYCDDVVAEAKPLIIVSCWSEAASQEADLGVSQGETASTRMTEEQCRIDHSRDVGTASTSTSVPQHLLLIPTPAEQRSETTSVRDEAGGLHGTTENTGQHNLVKDRDIVCGANDRCLNVSSKLQVNQHGMSNDGQSTQGVNKGHVCDVCNKVFTHRCHLVRHKLTHARYGYGKHTASKYNNGSKQSDSRLPEHKMFSGERSVVSSNVYYCEICGQAFQCMSEIIRHMRTHTGEKPFACEMCKKAFSRRNQVTVHMHTHLGKKPYACEVCKKAFSHPSQVTVHMRTHTGEKPHACVVCRKAFSRRSHLTSHMRTHAGKKPYACEVCKKAFNHPSQVTVHMRTHTGEKPHVCEVCRKAFSVRSQVTRHMRTHTGEKPHACEVCRKAFSCRSQVTRHMRTHAREILIRV